MIRTHQITGSAIRLSLSSRWAFIMVLSGVVFSSIGMGSSLWGQTNNVGETQRPVPSWEEIQNLINTAERSPRTVSQSDLLRERQLVTYSLQQVEQRLINERYRVQWRSYLKLDELAGALQPNVSFNDRQWEEIGNQLWKSRVVWPDPSIVTLQKAVQSYAESLRVAVDPNYLEYRQATLKNLREEIASYSQTEKEDVRQRIGQTAGWLKQRNDASGLVNALEAKFLHPNMIVSLSSKIFARELNRPLNETFPINDVYVGTYVYGNGSLTGNLTSRLTNTNGYGAVSIDLSAQILAYTSGSSSGVGVSSSGNTTVTGSKAILFDEYSVRALPATALAQSAVQITGINAPGGRYGEEARRRVYGNRWHAEQQARASAEQLARTRMDGMAADFTTRLNEQLRRDVLNPLALNNMLPRSVTSRAQSNQLQIEGVVGDWSELGAPTVPPPVNPEADATLMIHRSVMENVTGGKLRGRRMNEQEFLKQIGLGSVVVVEKRNEEESDDEVDLDEPESQTQLSFDDQLPVEVQMSDNQLVITLRLKEIESGGTVYPGVNITLPYSIHLSQNVATLQREADPEVLPSAHEGTKGKRLSGPQQVLRKTLIRRLIKSIPEETPLKQLTGMNLDLKDVQVANVRSNEGWLQIELVNPPATAAVP